MCKIVYRAIEFLAAEKWLEYANNISVNNNIYFSYIIYFYMWKEKLNNNREKYLTKDPLSLSLSL